MPEFFRDVSGTVTILISPRGHCNKCLTTTDLWDFGPLFASGLLI
jgi:hypothetical protein